MYDEPNDQALFMRCFYDIRAAEMAHQDTYSAWRAAIKSGNSVLISAFIEATSSTRKGPKVR